MKGRQKFIWVLIAAFIFIILYVGIILWKENVVADNNKIPFQKGMCYVTWNKNAYNTNKSDKSLEKLQSMGVEYVAIVPTWYQEDVLSVEIKPEALKTPSDEGIIRAIKKAHELGLKVMMKPQVDILKSEGSWRGDITFVKEESWNKWFDSYANFIMHYVDICIEQNVEILCIGTELTATALERPDLWRTKIITPIRAKYKGLITYAANWYKEYSEVGFWHDLDFAGVDAYFPIGDNDVVDLETLRKNWKDWLVQIKVWQKKINMPVCFPEVGYKSSTGTSIYPWEYLPGKEVDLKQQRDCFQALIDTFGDKEWFCGVYWWYWGTALDMGGKDNRGFIIQNKPGEELISDWYKGAYSPYKETATEATELPKEQAN